MKNYKTVADSEIFSAEYEIKKSIFIAHVKHVETEETAREFVQSIRKNILTLHIIVQRGFWVSLATYKNQMTTANLAGRLAIQF